MDGGDLRAGHGEVQAKEHKATATQKLYRIPVAVLNRTATAGEILWQFAEVIIIWESDIAEKYITTVDVGPPRTTLLVPIYQKAGIFWFLSTTCWR